jgi:alpha-galactosidase
MTALTSYVHSLGLKIGIYSSPDAQTFATWGFDYLKYDWCSAGKVYQPVTVQKMVDAYNLMYKGLQATGRPIVYSIDECGMLSVWQWGASTGANLWRTSQDVKDDFYEMAEIGFGQVGLQSYAGPGSRNDPDMLQVGNGGMTNDQYQTQMTLWCILSAPLIAGNDLTAMTPPVLAILANQEVTAVDQDSRHSG